MRYSLWALTAMLSLALLTGCEDGPAERAGKKLDHAWDKLTGKGPAEKAGERIDEAIDALKKK